MFDHGNLRITPPPMPTSLMMVVNIFFIRPSFLWGGRQPGGVGPAPLDCHILGPRNLPGAGTVPTFSTSLCLWRKQFQSQTGVSWFRGAKTRKESKAPSGTEFSYEVFVCMDGNFLFFVFNLQSSRKKADERSLNDTFVFSIDLIAQK